jgi:sulfur-oxidizing protein SoxY
MDFEGFFFALVVLNNFAEIEYAYFFDKRGIFSYPQPLEETAQMNHLRRALLKGSGAAGALAVAAAAGLLRPSHVLAVEWNKSGFEAKTAEDALKSIGAPAPANSGDILIKAPDIAENGAVVPIEVTSKIAGTQSIALVADKNPFPLVATFNLANGAEGYVSVRIKMGQSSNVRAVVTADGKHYAAVKEVKVTIGGCGG